MATFSQTPSTDLNSILQAHAMRDKILFAPILNGVVSLVKLLATSWKRSNMRRQLEALDDRQLQDIGLGRSDISGLVANAFRGNLQTAKLTSAPAELYYMTPAQPAPTVDQINKLAA